jgi:hypothetical protein
MSDEEYMEAITPLIEATVKWAAKKYRLRAGGVMSTEDIESELWVAALKKQGKLQPRLEAGETGYVVKALQYSAHDAMEPEWSHEKEAGGTLEDLETGLYDEAPRTVASKNPDPTPLKILRSAAKAADHALERAQQERAAAVFMATLTDSTDREILRLHLGTWTRTGDTVPAIALQVGLSEKTVYRRLAAIKRRLLDSAAASETEEPLNIGEG